MLRNLQSPSEPRDSALNQKRNTHLRILRIFNNSTFRKTEFEIEASSYQSYFMRRLDEIFGVCFKDITPTLGSSKHSELRKRITSVLDLPWDEDFNSALTLPE